MQGILRINANLTVCDGKVYSYQSHVADISNNILWIRPEFEHYSVTTSKHLTLVAKHYNLTKVVCRGGENA
jgi:hypothetical protein